MPDLIGHLLYVLWMVLALNEYLLAALAY